jgi:hypothetical protein
LCRDVLERLKAQRVVVVHVGTGGDDFHARARLPVVDYTKAL